VKDRLTELAERREQLQRQAALQRQELGQHLGAIDARLRFVDTGLTSVRS